MKFNFKIQEYQTQAVEAVVSVFAGQPRQEITYLRDLGRRKKADEQQTEAFDDAEFEATGFRNADLVLTDDELLHNIRQTQMQRNINVSKALSKEIGRCQLDVEMDTGTGKTYFSIDKKGRAVNSETKRGADISDDTSAYDLILKNKERLLDFREPCRFIYSHSALREGWDNPNVFQICTLKHSDSATAKRQEVGRGLRLCVDQNGVRQDAMQLGAEGNDDSGRHQLQPDRG